MSYRKLLLEKSDQEKVWNEHIQPGVAHARTCPADLEIDCISLNVFTQSLSKAQRLQLVSDYL